MNCTIWKIASPVLITALLLLGRVEAQQDHKQHHPEGAPASQAQMSEATPDVPAQAPMGQPMQGMMQQMQGMMQQMQGMVQQMHSQMGRGGMMGRGMMGDRDDDESSDDDDMMRRGMMGRGMMMGGYPFGHPLSEPFAVPQHLRILRDMLYALERIQEPGTIIDFGYRWRRERYEDSA